MRKKFLATMLCVAMGLTMCACGATTPSSSDIPTPEVTATEAPEATATVAPTEGANEEAEALPITNYDDCVATTTLPESYVGIEVAKITDEDVQAYFDELRLQNMALEEVDRAVEEGDVANIDFTGYIDGVAFDGGADTGFDLEIGSGQFIEGFEEGLIGAVKGETRSLELAFPEDYYSTDLAGKDVVFEVKVNTVSEYVLPEMTDDFVNKITSGEYTNVADFTEYANGLLTEEQEYMSVMDYLVENSTFGELNEAYVQASLDSMKEYYESYAAMFGVDMESFMQMMGVTDTETFWNDMAEEMRRSEKERIVLYCVAKAENITLTEEEFTSSATELAESYSLTLDEFLADYDRTYVEQSILMERGLAYLLDNIVTVEK
ncbi:MAG: trigger factor [Lachnospiraceae bacterium]|nr:trigger factor [Lachnospiraceae bacterium]